MKDLLDLLVEMGHLFDRLSIPYALMGGFAVRAYAFPRNTLDLDFTIAIDTEKLPILLNELKKIGCTVPEAYEKGWLDRVSGMPVLKARLYLEDHGLDVDIFIAEWPYQQELIKRRVRETVDDIEVCLVTAEDLILLKLLANRPRDRIDVDDLLFALGTLDTQYMRKWATELNISQSLEDALNKHGLE